MSVTLTNLRDGVDKLVGDYRVITTTAAGATTTLVASAAANYWPASYIVDWWAEITGTSANAEVRQITAFDGATVTVRSAFSTTPGTGNTAKIKRYDPLERDYALADACREVYPDLHTVKVDDTLVTGNVLVNSNMEDWPSNYSGAGTIAPTAWVCANATGTATRVTGRFGTYALRLTSATIAADSIYQDETTNPSLLDLKGKQLSMHGWFKGVSGTTSGIISIYCIDEDGTATTQNSTITPVGGAGEWNEFEFNNIVFPDTLITVVIALKAGQAGTSDWDNLYLCDTVWQYNIPAGFTEKPRQLWVSGAGADYVQTTSWTACHNWRILNDSGTLKLVLSQPFSMFGYKMRLVGAEPLICPTTAAGTLALTALQEQRLLHLAASLMFERLIASGGNQNQAQLEKNRDWFRARAQALRTVKMIPPVKFLEVR